MGKVGGSRHNMSWEAQVPLKRVFQNGLGAILLPTACIVVVLAPMVADLGSAQVTYHMEVMTLQTSQETWMRTCAGERGAWLMPSWNGAPRLRKPPMSVWLNLLAWRGLNPANASVETLVWRSRLLGVLLTALALAATYWIARHLGDRRSGAAACLVAGTMFLLLRQARLASYDTHLLAWCTVAVAGGLHALRPTGPPASFAAAALGWTLAAFAGGLAVMTKGALALVLIWAPLAVMALLAGRRRAANFAPMAAALLLAVALASPWFLYAAAHFGDTLTEVADEYRAQRNEFQPPWYYLGLFGLVFPWCIPFGMAVAAPFRGAARPGRGLRLIPWAWWATLFLLLSIPGAKQQRYIVPALPAAAIMVAQWWLTETSGESERWVFRRLHFGVLAGLSVIGPLFIALQPVFVRLGWMARAEIEGLAWPALLALAATCASLAALGARLHAQGRRFASLACTALWMVVLAATVFPGYARSWHGRYRQLDDGRRVLAAVGQAQFLYLDLPDVSYRDEPNQKLLLYARRVIPRVEPAALTDLAKAGEPVYVMAPAEASADAPLAAAGFEPLFDWHDGSTPRRLWRNAVRGE